MMARSATLFLATILSLLLAAAQAATTVVSAGTDLTRIVLQGRIVTPDETLDGEIVIDNDTITCVDSECTHPAGAWILRVEDAFIFPGFIDAHNHVAYNVFPKWNPPRFYKNRGQWQASQSYLTFKAPYNALKRTRFCEMVKYGEVRALLSGITTIQGTAPNNQCFRTLLRNAENQHQLPLPSGHVRTYILDIGSFDGAVDFNRTKSFVVHLAEGAHDDPPSRREFTTLKQKGLLKAGTAIIHGTAFGDDEFRQMGNAGAKLIWSPRSNLVLYDETTDIRLAYRHNVTVSLGVDWNPTGSNNLFDELRVAAKLNEEEFDRVIPQDDWIKLITVNPARALALDGHIGRLAVGKKADITVVRRHHADPNRSLLLSRLQDVEMVWLGGDLLYADRPVVERLKPGKCEAMIVGGSRKRVCVVDRRDPVPGSTQTLAVIRDRLRQKYPGLAPLTP
jgi:5-methylthioadenosine/S-adenosylhomocysteine deaminase